MRRISKEIKAGKTSIGGGSRITVQSMLNTDTDDINASTAQIKRLYDAGCDIIRFTVKTPESAGSVYSFKNQFPDIPFVADIHFDYKTALACIDAGIDKIRINPGNIGDADRIKAVADAARMKSIPIRIGVNSGSLEKHLLEKYGSPTAEALAESALYHASLLERFDFDDIVISVKSSDVRKTIAANRIIAEKCTYPIHLGVTEAGTKNKGIIKSAVGIGSLLCDGIGDTVRISLTDDPVEEVYAAKALLDSIGISLPSVTVISCPTCGRTQIDLIKLCREFDAMIPELHPSRPIKVALMGCVVNGPGEAAECDIGIAGGKDEALLFKYGKPVRKIVSDEILKTLKDEINKL